MGAGQSVDQYVETNSKFTQTTKFMQSMKNDANVNVVTKQNVSVTFDCDGGTEFSGNIDVNQNAKVKVSVIQLGSSGINAKQLADLKTAVSNDCKSLQNKANEDYGAVLGAMQAGQQQHTTIKNAIETAVNSEITNESVTNLFAKAQVDQDGNIVFKSSKKCIINGNITAGQDIQLEMVAQQVVTSVIDSVMDTAAVQEIANKAESEMKAENSGIATVVDSLGTAVGTVLQSSQTFFIVLGIVAIIGIYLYLRPSSGDKPGARPGSVASMMQQFPGARSMAPMMQQFQRPQTPQFQQPQFQQPPPQQAFQQPPLQAPFQQPPFQQPPF